MDGDPDDDDHGGPPFPWTVRVAGVIWLVLGGLPLLAVVGVFVYSLLSSGGGEEYLRAVCVAAVIGSPLVGIGFVTYRSMPPDTIDVGIVSIGMAILFFGAAALGLILFTTPTQGLDGVFVFTAAGFGAILLTAGTLAIGGRGQYLAWKARHEATEAPNDSVGPNKEGEGPASEPRRGGGP